MCGCRDFWVGLGCVDVAVCGSEFACGWCNFVGVPLFLSLSVANRACLGWEVHSDGPPEISISLFGYSVENHFRAAAVGGEERKEEYGIQEVLEEFGEEELVEDDVRDEEAEALDEVITGKIYNK
ncbi:hypothetical protein F0562_034555 [Nyssa sinensis]|uniref:Uncharacterized protein n=1 Tax=Nyssa sinensis TaxID=561372 RepID=A0A5J5ALS0_9ASTE|nr:hypothetical protein F0562_034555 [Nyssa sinensis]